MMNKIEKTVLYVKLFNAYKELLSATQKEMISDYYLADLSFSEKGSTAAFAGNWRARRRAGSSSAMNRISCGHRESGARRNGLTMTLTA